MFAIRYIKSLFPEVIGFLGLILLFIPATTSHTLAQEPYQRLVQRFEMPELGIPNSAGLAFSPAANVLLVSPSPGNADLMVVTFAPDLTDSINLATALVDPVNMAFDGQFNTLVFWDANVEELIEIKSGANSLPQPTAEAITRFNGKSFGATQAQGMTFDPETGDLFFLIVPSGEAVPQIVRITPDSVARFDGDAANQDGRIANIPLNSLQGFQLRGIAFNPYDEHLYIIRPIEQILYEVTQEGELLSTRDLSSFEEIGATELTNVQNIAFAPSGDQTDDPAIMNLYIADNGLKSQQGLGDIFELSLTQPNHLELVHLSINDVVVLEGDSSTVNAVFAVTLSGASQQNITVDYATQDETATAASDYVSGSGTLTFGVGDTSKSIVVAINGDLIEEGHETFLVNLSNARGFVTIGDDQGTATIINDDPGYINVPADYSTIQEAFNSAAEGDTILVAPGFYPEAILLSGKSVVFASWFLITGDSSYISQTIIDGNGNNAVIRIESSVGSSTNIIGFTIQNADDGISPHAKFDILNCRIIDCSDGIDYEAGSGGLCKFNLFENNSDDGIDLDNAVDIIIEHNIIRNNKDDGIEIRLQSYNGPMLNYIIRNNEIYGNNEDGIQLIDYDGLSDRIFILEGNLIYNNRMVGLGCMSVGNTKENFEGASIPERIFLFNNTFSANAYGVTGGDSLVALNNIFANHTVLATKNVDAGSIIANGIFWNNSANFENCNVDSANILGTDPLLDAQFHLQPMSSAIDAGTAFFTWYGDTVLNLPASRYKGIAPDLGAFEYSNDPIPSLAIDDVSVTECSTGTVNATFTVMLSAACTQIVTVEYATADGTATAPDDYNAIALAPLSFAPGTTKQTITVAVNGDMIYEPSETFFVNLNNALNATIADNQGVGTIVNNGGIMPVTVSFQGGVNGYNGARDTKLVSHTPSTNYGIDNRLEVNGWQPRSALLYWDLTNIPPQSKIQSADITVNVTNKSEDNYEFYEMLRPWVEGEATWNEYASGQSWQVAGADGSEDRGSTVLGAVVDSSEGLSTITLDSTGIAVLQSWVNNPANNHGLIIMDYLNADDGWDFSSRENTTASKRPRLTVAYYTNQVSSVESPEFPQEFQLNQNYPNPFNPTTKISYSITKSAFVTLKIYDMLGREVRTMVSEIQQAGTRSIEFDASSLSGGIYFYTLQVGNDSEQTKKMLFLK